MIGGGCYSLAAGEFWISSPSEEEYPEPKEEPAGLLSMTKCLGKAGLKRRTALGFIDGRGAKLD